MPFKKSKWKQAWPPVSDQKTKEDFINQWCKTNNHIVWRKEAIVGDERHIRLQLMTKAGLVLFCTPTYTDETAGEAIDPLYSYLKHLPVNLPIRKIFTR
jgi:hypothetical protein